MKNEEINRLKEENAKLVQKSAKLEGVLGRVRANIMSLEFPREHQSTVDKVFQAVERAITSV
jgi:hypothetical protein